MAILSMFGNRLVPRADPVVSSLSYANRRRVEIARALASRPKLLLLDEPTAGMNPAETLELADQIKSLNRLGLSIVLIEHKLDVVVNLANRVIVLDHGEKIAEGSPAEERLRQLAGTLSGGEQQMVAIGRALMARPRLLCMDEPSMGLAPVFVEQVFDIIQTINRQGTTIFMVEQNANMALSIANRAYVLQTGQVVLSGAADELRRNPMIREAYLGEMKVE